MTARQMHLMAQIGVLGNHQGAWRAPGVAPEELFSLRPHIEIAQLAEAEKLDAVFMADLVGHLGPATYVPRGNLEPISLLSALAVVTERIGLVGTVSTSFSEPFNVARQFASLDHISGGRAGWNIVTSAVGEENFGTDPLPPHRERYARAAEHLEVASKLWSSWERDALLLDRAEGRYSDPEKVHRIDHQGRFFSVAGPLNLPRSPQGRPVFVQAGASEEGRDLAARHAEVVFTAQQSLEDAQTFSRDLKARAAAFGRDPGQVKVLLGVSAIIGDSEAAARAERRALADLVEEGYARSLVSFELAGADLSTQPLDAPLPPELLPDASQVRRRKSRFEVFRKLAVEDRLTLRELIEIEAVSSGHWVLTGTAPSVADILRRYVAAGACDGFVFLPVSLPSLARVIREVVPLLRATGDFRAEYSGRTLRDHLGLLPL